MIGTWKTVLQQWREEPLKGAKIFSRGVSKYLYYDVTSKIIKVKLENERKNLPLGLGKGQVLTPENETFCKVVKKKR